MTKAIFWDCDGTIIHKNESFRDSLVKTLSDFGVMLSNEEAKQYLKAACSWFFPDKAFTQRVGQYWWEDLFVNLAPLFDKYAISQDMLEQIQKRFIKNVIEFPYIPYEGIFDVLRSCKELGYNNYVISSNYPELGVSLERLGFGQYFDGYFLSANIGYEKPQKTLFEYAYNHAGCPEYCYMVGDNPIADVIGAKEANMKTILVHNCAGEVKPDFVVQELSEILNCVQRD